MADTTVRDNPDQHRYEIYAGDELAGFADYRDRGATLSITHTEIVPAYEGKGLASTLVRAVLDDLRAKRLGVLPYCPFVKRYVQRHTEYHDLVPAAVRADFGLPPAE